MELEKDPQNRVSKVLGPGVRPEGTAEIVSTSTVYSICNNYLVIIKYLRLTGELMDDCSPIVK